MDQALSPHSHSSAPRNGKPTLAAVRLEDRRIVSLAASEPWPYCRERDPQYDDHQPQTWNQYVEWRREFKLTERMLSNRATPAYSEDPVKIMAAAKEFEAQLEREKAKGLPQLTTSEMAQARKQFDEVTATFAKIKLPHNTVCLPVIQLRRDEFPELPWPLGKDIFQLLWCPRVHFDGNGIRDPGEIARQSPGFALKWRTERLVGPALTKTPVPREGDGLTDCALHPEEIAEYPQAGEFDREQIKPHLDRLGSLLDRPGGGSETDAFWKYSYDFAVAPGSKLLGHPQWIQDDETPACTNCGNRMNLLVTCASQEDADSLIWSPAARRAQRDPYENPSGQSWGDFSNAYIFYCARCRPLRIRSVVQTS